MKFGKLLTTFLALGATVAFGASKLPFPGPTADQATVTGKQVAVLAGGCFWGVAGVFERVKGVTNVVSGYAGGEKDTAHYERVSEGDTGHAESVQITYDPSVVTYGQLLRIYFAVAHDPTELNYQGPDHGTQYRSAIFFTTEDQKRVAEAYIKQLDDEHIYKKPIVTQVTPLKGFYAAESYHQQYLDHHPDSFYIMANDLPKVQALQKQFPEMCVRR